MVISLPDNVYVTTTKLCISWNIESNHYYRTYIGRYSNKLAITGQYTGKKQVL